MFLRFLSVVALAAAAAAAGAEAGAAATANDLQCMQRSVGAHLAVVTNYNATGHWMATVRLERDTPLPGRPTVVLLDVRPSASQCGNVRTDTLVITLQGPPPPLPAGPGFEEVRGIGYYKVHEERVSWEEAKAVCESEDAHLLILNSEAEASGVQELIRRRPSIKDWVHVGFNDKQREGQYFTIFGQPLTATGFSRWSTGQPDNAGNNEHCGSIHISTMGLNDLPCTTYMAPFVCEHTVG